MPTGRGLKKSRYMTFDTWHLLAWIGAAVPIFWLMPAPFRPWVLVLISGAFLAAYDPVSCAILAALTLSTHFLTRKKKLDGVGLVFAIIPALGMLIIYKMFSAAVGDDSAVRTLIPFGLSFYTLRCIHYAFERYKGRIGEQSLANVVGYLFFIPTLFVGPVHRFPEFERDGRRRRWDSAMFSEGLERILYGYVKISVLGNFLVSDLFGAWADRVTIDGSGPAVYLEMVRVGLNLYLQFSGYSDIAIGFARLLGYRVMENFSWPFLKRNISEFWRSWHVSLTSFAREYVYNGVIATTRNPALASIATMVAIGLWHEMSLRYLAWGFYHGAGIVIWQWNRRLWSGRPPIGSTKARLVLDGVGTIATVHFVCLGFLLVRQPGFAEMANVLDSLFTGWF